MEKYSVLMSVYHKEQPEFLRLSMESMFSQTAKPDEFVLMCDGPLTDGLDEVIESMLQKYPDILRVVRLPENQGLANALNTGIPLCRNDLVARMDSDDVADPLRCELQLHQFSLDPRLVIVGGAIDEFEGVPDNVITHKSMPETHEQILSYARKRCPFNHPTVMYRKSAVLELGGYPDIPLHEDYGLWANLLMAGYRGYNLPKTLCAMRVDTGLYSRRGGMTYFRTAAAFRRELYRKGFYPLGSYLLVVSALAVVCLIPTGLRKAVYRKVLR